MKKERMQLIILMVLVVAGFSYGYISYLLLPQLGNLENKGQEIQLKEAEYVDFMTYAANPGTLDEKIEIYNKELQNIATLMPSSLDRALITYHTYATMKRNNLIGENIVFEAPEDKGTHVIMNITLTVSGLPADILKAINELQSNSDAMVLRSANFTAEDEVIKAEVKLQAYALQGNQKRIDDLPFMNVPIGIDQLDQLFPKKEILIESQLQSQP